MAKYITRRSLTKAYIGDDCGWDMRSNVPSITVITPEDEPAPTGLLNSGGMPLYRLSERVEAGFWPHRRRESDA